jgi:23S rRNA (uracil1939-C5)-methyltransferase
MKKGEVLKLRIEDYAFEGKGICKVPMPDDPDKKFVVFVHGAYPGDEVEAQIIKKKKSYAEAKTINVISPAEYRVKAKCTHFGICGGCKQQDLSYDRQLYYKEAQVKDVFERIGGFSDLKVESIVPSENIFFYRNKLEYSFAGKRWLTKEEIGNQESIDDRNFALGFHVPRIFDKVVDIKECFLQSEVSNKILNFTRNFFKPFGTSIFSTRTHEGYLRNLVIKQSQHLNDLMVNLVTSSDDPELMKNYSESIKEHIPEITTIVNNINEKKANVAIGDYEKIYLGDGYIFDTIGKYKFRISSNSFFQTNTIQADNLYQIAKDFAQLNGNEIAYDLYSGAGTISIFISDSCKEVHAFESVEPAVEDAKVNSTINEISNVHFHLADLNKSFLPIIEKHNIPKPDFMMIDPPRAGMNPKTVKDVLKLLPEKIVYVSCNPASQARDIQLLCEEKYELIKMKPVDMFPHTFHIENVALLKMK